MHKPLLKLGALIAVCLLLSSNSYAQPDIFRLMERRDLRIDQIEQIADRYFDSVGTGQGSGYKQYQRWLYETRFHINDNGFILPDDHDWNAYQKGRKEMLIESNSGASWVEKGPFSWNRTSGWNPGVGRVTSLWVNPANNNEILISSPGGGIWKTTNGGTTWAPLTDNDAAWMNMFSVAVSYDNSDIILAGSSGGFLIRSLNGGNTWTNEATGLGTVWKILFHPTNSQIVFAAANGGIYRSTNAGDTWTRITTTSVQDIEFKPDDPSVMYASGNAVHRSTDGGLTWTTLGSGNGIVASARTLIGVSPANPDVVYLAQANGSEFGRLYKSTDAGQSFTVTVTGSSTTCTNYFGYETSGCGTGGQAGYDMGICVAADNADEVYIAGIIVWKSLNGGSSFSPMTAWSLPNSIGYNHADVHALEWISGKVFSGSDGGIYRSNDRGDNWTDLSTGLGIRQFYRIANSKTVNTTFSGGAQDNGSSIHKFTGWVDWLGADGMDCLISPLDVNLQWGTSQNGTLYRTTDGGNTRSTLPKPSGATGNWVTPIAIENNTNTIYTGWNDVYKSTDRGSTWTNLTGTVISSNIVALTVAPSDPRYIYASIGSNLYTTTDGGSTWSIYTAPVTINAIAVNPSNPLRVWIACNSSSNRIFVSDNGGATWTNKSAGMAAGTPRSVTVYDDTEESVYVGANIGVYYTNNTLSTWVDLSENLPKVAINEVEIQKAGSLLRVATYGRGVWERPLYGVAPACNAPATLIATSITQTTATLEWQAASGATGYLIEYKATGTTDWTVAAANHSSTTLIVSGLSQATTYDWRVATNCATGTSPYATDQFTTLEACPAPTALNTTDITTASAIVRWTESSLATSYVVNLKESGSATWTTVANAAIGNNLPLSGLQPATSYDWQIQSACPVASSTWISSSFTTAAPIVCTDVYESNNSSKQSKTIAVGSAISASIGSSNDEDWFKFSLGNDRSTNIRLTLYNLPADYDVYLYNKSLQLLAAGTMTGTSSEELVYNTNTLRMTYYVKVVSKTGEHVAADCYNMLVENSSSAWNAGQPTLITQTGTPTANNASIRPNPASTRAIMSFTSDHEGYADLRIMSLNGVVHETFGIAVRNGLNQVTLETGDLKSGMYLVQVKNQHMRIIKQLVILQ